MHKRRNYFIKKKFQMSFFVPFIILLLIEIVLIAGLFIYISSNTITAGYHDSVLTVDRTPHFFLVSLIFIMLIGFVGIGLVGLIAFILFSHRIAGPLYRFEKVLNNITEGDLTTRINLRKTDELMELKEALNSLMDTMDKRVGNIKKCADELEDLVSKKDDPQTKARFQEVLNRLRDEARYFKVTSKFKE